MPMTFALLFMTVFLLAFFEMVGTVPFSHTCFYEQIISQELSCAAMLQ
jgi:hypothetical protein